MVAPLVDDQFGGLCDPLHTYSGLYDPWAGIPYEPIFVFFIFLDPFVLF